METCVLRAAKLKISSVCCGERGVRGEETYIHTDGTEGQPPFYRLIVSAGEAQMIQQGSGLSGRAAQRR